MVAALVAVSACSEDEVSVPPTASTVEVTPRISSIVSGQTVQLAAQGKDVSGNAMSGGTVTWKSLDTTVARVSTSGLVTALSSGSTAIVATVLGATGFATIDAIGVVATVFITGTTGELPIGQSVQLRASPREANGRELFRPVTWTSSAPTIATVSSNGLVTSVAVGTANITATVDGKTATQAITILPPPPVATVAVSPSSGFLPTTVGVPMTATLKDASGATLNGRVVAWASSNTAVATVSATGVATAQTVGPVTITASSEGKSGSVALTALTGVKSGAAAIIVENSAESEDPFVAYKDFAIYVPTGSTQLVVRLASGTGDPDLYLFPPGVTTLGTSWVCRSWNAGPGETCTMTNPAAGVWRIVVDSYNKHTGTQLTATITPTPP